MQNLLLRHWLTSGGIVPDRDVQIVNIPPPQMVANLAGGNLLGFCCGEPWNSRAAHEDSGFTIATDLDIWDGHPEKVLGARADFIQTYPHAYLALVKSLLEACRFCEPDAHRDEVLQLLCRPEYLNVDPVYVRPGFNGFYRKGVGTPSVLKGFNRFTDNAPSRSEYLWLLAQLARWDILKFPPHYGEVLDNLLHIDVYHQAAEELELPIEIADASPIQLADGTVFDPSQFDAGQFEPGPIDTRSLVA